MGLTCPLALTPAGTVGARMAVERNSEYRHLGVGDGLALEVSGPTIEACLARAIEGLADGFADVHPSRNGEIRPIELEGTTPSRLLRALLDESVRLLSEGGLVILLTECTVTDGSLLGRWEVVTLDASRPATAPWRLRWHEASLEPDGAGWAGRAIASF